MEQLEILATADWNGDVRFYRVSKNAMPHCLILINQVNVGYPVYKIEWSEDAKALYIALSNGIIQAIDIKTCEKHQIASHPGLLTFNVVSMNNETYLISTCKNKKLIVWKPGNIQPHFSMNIHHLPLVSDYSFPYVVFGCQNSVVGVLNLRTFQESMTVKFSPCKLESPIMSIAVKPNSEMIGIGSIDGRTCYSEMVFNKNSNSLKLVNLILFRAHKLEPKKNTTDKYLYQVNCIGFNAKLPNFLYTGGSEGNIFFWDTKSKNKSADFVHGATSVTAMDI